MLSSIYTYYYNFSRRSHINITFLFSDVANSFANGWKLIRVHSRLIVGFHSAYIKRNVFVKHFGGGFKGWKMVQSRLCKRNKL